MSETPPHPARKKPPLTERPRFMYFYMLSLLVFILVSGYVLIFSGSLLFEGIFKGWYTAETSMEDNYALWLSFLTAFPCLLGLIGGITVLSTGTARFHNVKILLFVPSVVWTVQLVIVNFKWGLEYWMGFLYLVPAMLLSIFILYCVVKEVRIPILSIKSRTEGAENTVSP